MNRKSFRVCRYCNCPHPLKQIDISTDDFVVDGKLYYHRKCYDTKLDEEEKNKQKSKDYEYFRNQWVKNISNTVVYSQLYKVLNELIARGIELDYLIFTLNYIIEHKMNLHYPAGFPYFVDKKEIKEAYAKKKLASSGYNKNSFVAVENDDTAPKFSVNKKPNGFQSILKNNG
ncbi:MAG: hypothetical protein SPE24_08235 [Erysipelotrichaceae bacterium]|nr:hypothetical protein [Erysipelotrichaceae bacterium]